MCRTIFDINRSNIFLVSSPRVMKIKTKINKWDLIKLKSFGTAKETINKTKRQPTEWEKIFANDATDKGFICKIYKQLTQLNIKKQTTLGASLVVQQLRLHASTAGGMGSIPGQGTEIPHTMGCGQNKRTNEQTTQSKNGQKI